MAEEDRIKWDRKYRERKETPRVNSLVRCSATLARHPGRALDLACGAGHNSQFLADLGFTVDAVDISPVALAGIHHPRICTLERDLDTYTITPGAYDLIVDTYFLDRRLFGRITAGLKPGGVLLFETWTVDSKRMSNPAFMLERNELPQAFSSLTTLSYSETDGVASYAGRK
ncbi:MAG: methyltransferase domain-containing protein [Acidobacteriota bacterium]|nr:methyltransferase domain-containing protein [Acidobacteriota bacterium]